MVGVLHQIPKQPRKQRVASLHVDLVYAVQIARPVGFIDMERVGVSHALHMLVRAPVVEEVIVPKIKRKKLLLRANIAKNFLRDFHR